MKEQFDVGEHVVKGDERGVIVELKNRTTGEKFPMVWILTGPRKNQREYPSKGWKLEEETGDYSRPDYDEDAETSTQRREFNNWMKYPRRRPGSPEQP